MSFGETERKANDERDRRLREKADSDCHACYGRGKTKGYITPGKYAEYACFCTGEADWQR